MWNQHDCQHDDYDHHHNHREHRSHNPFLQFLHLCQYDIIRIITIITSSCQVVQEYERAVIFRLGRLQPGGAKGPGLNLLVQKFKD